MTDTVPAPAGENPVQVYLSAGQGAPVITAALPLDPQLQRQLDAGELRRVNPDGSPYEGEDGSGLDAFEKLVADAEHAAEQAEQHAATLEHHLVDGDQTVTAAKLDSARRDSRFKRLLVKQAQRRAERARESERQRQLAALRSEIDAYAAGSGAQFARLAEQVESAAAAFVEQVEARNRMLAAWRKRMIALNVPQHVNPISPPAEHGRLGWGGADVVISGMRRLGRVNAGQWLSVAVSRAAKPAGRVELSNGPARVTLVAARDDGDANPYAKLRQVDAELPDPPPRHFYRGPSGAVIERDTPYPAEEIQRLGLTPISRKEAWGQ